MDKVVTVAFSFEAISSALYDVEPMNDELVSEMASASYLYTYVPAVILATLSEDVLIAM